MLIIVSSSQIGCDMVIRKLINKENNENQDFIVQDYDIKVTCPGDWIQTNSDNLDFQVVNKSQSIYMSIFAYMDMDITEWESVKDFFASQNQALLDKRDSVTLIEELAEVNYEDKIIYSILYSAEYDGIKNYYFINFVDFKESDRLAWVLFTGTPSVISVNRENLDSTLLTLTTIK
jgi:hypothetical protein